MQSGAFLYFQWGGAARFLRRRRKKSLHGGEAAVQG